MNGGPQVGRGLISQRHRLLPFLSDHDSHCPKLTTVSFWLRFMAGAKKSMDGKADTSAVCTSAPLFSHLQAEVTQTPSLGEEGSPQSHARLSWKLGWTPDSLR
jgi:hypothetical protein